MSLSIRFVNVWFQNQVCYNGVIAVRRCHGKMFLWYESLFPEIYSIAWDKEAIMSDFMDSSGTYVHWNLDLLFLVFSRK